VSLANKHIQKTKKGEKTMNNASLISHVDTRKIARYELGMIPTPPATDTHQPVPHLDIVEAIDETLALRNLKVVRDEYAVSKDGMRMFGIMEVEENFPQPMFQSRTEEKMFRFAIGLRNANDKTMRLGLTAGYRVVVCDNMAFSGDFVPAFHKHTKRLELSQVISIAVDKIQRNFIPLRKQIDEWREFPISDEDAKVVIYDAFRSSSLKLPLRFLHSAHRHYFEPLDKEFTDRTFWSLSNAFTSMIKELPPVKQFQITAKLGEFLNSQYDQFWGGIKVEEAEVVQFPVAKAVENERKGQPALVIVGRGVRNAIVSSASNDVSEQNDDNVRIINSSISADDMIRDDTSTDEISYREIEDELTQQFLEKTVT
jgi:hypothetical protein